eukprot:6212039-Pleurochrysis_carterae.AAC.3
MCIIQKGAAFNASYTAVPSCAFDRAQHAEYSRSAAASAKAVEGAHRCLPVRGLSAHRLVTGGSLARKSPRDA